MRNRPIFALLLLSACSTQTSPTPSIAAPSATLSLPSAWPYQSNVAAVAGTHGVVASDAPLASQVGVEILKAGGNAADAAVAVGFALAVVYPEAGNIGGGGFSLVRMADGRVGGFDYREVAPLAATRNMYVDANGKPTPSGFADDSGRAIPSSLVGPLASGVPGSVAGLVATHHRFGVLPLARVMAPAIRLASEGFVVDSLQARSFERYRKLIQQFGGGNTFAPGGSPIARGTLFKQPALAQTLRAIADSGAAAFYSGGLAQRVAADLKAAGSIITAEDLAKYKVEPREPLRAMYRGHAIMTMPPSSSGATMIEALNILEGFGPLPPYGSARSVHLIGASLQRAFVDRNQLMGDPAFTQVPVGRLTDKSYAAKLRAGIGDRATPSNVLAPLTHEGTQTTHYVVADAQGNVVSTTTTLNDLYGSGVYLPNVGFFMNDEMDDFAANPGQPNSYGLVQGEANAIQPGKRMLSSMLPTIVLDRTGQPLLVVGARGGPRIISAVMQIVINVVDHQMNIVDAMNAPRVHHQALPDTLRLERNGFTDVQKDSLRALGYAVGSISGVASANAIMRTRGGWVAYSDPRSGGRPAGY